MGKALLICDSPKGAEFYREFLTQNGFDTIEIVDNGDEARRRFIEYTYDICLINAPLNGQSPENLVIDIAEKNISQVLYFVRAEVIEEVTARVENYGVITVAKPINKQMFWSALKLARVAQYRVEMAQIENNKLRRKLEEVKLVTRAKLVLMQYRGMNEEEAHKFIEKKAMDERVSRLSVANDILDTYE